jgi:hypothetical protein
MSHLFGTIDLAGMNDSFESKNDGLSEQARNSKDRHGMLQRSRAADKRIVSERVRGLSPGGIRTT